MRIVKIYRKTVKIKKYDIINIIIYCLKFYNKKYKLKYHQNILLYHGFDQRLQSY